MHSEHTKSMHIAADVHKRPRLRKVYAMWYCGILEDGRFCARTRPVGIGYTKKQAFESWQQGGKS